MEQGRANVGQSQDMFGFLKSSGQHVLTFYASYQRLLLTLTDVESGLKLQGSAVPADD